MAPITNDTVAFLQEAKAALTELEELKNRHHELEITEKRLEKTLLAEKKAVDDNIELTVRERKEQISSTYDKEIRGDQEKLRKLNAKREKAKARGIRGRIEDETADLHEENRRLMVETKTLFRKNKVPSFCNTYLYYALFFTKSAREFLTLFIAALICFLGIPCGVYYVIPQRQPWYLIVIYFATIVLFGGGYLMISNKTKMRYLSILKEGRKNRTLIRLNNKKIKSITSSIQSDRNEDFYNLDKYDRGIAQIQQELDDIASRKKEALYTFENDTRLRIADEIRGNNEARLTSLKQRLNEAAAEGRDTDSMIKTLTITIADDYESYIGKEFMTFDGLDRLTRIFENGQAANMTEALEVARSTRE